MTRSPAPSSTPQNAAPRGATTAPIRRGDAIDHWLGMFTRFLRLPTEQSRAIRDELDSHMRERVRDLMLEGLSEDEGMRRAIDELGEAAELAAHFRAAHRPNRRLAMSIAAIGVAAGAAVVSIVALTQVRAPAVQPEMKQETRAVGYDHRPQEGMDPRAAQGVPMLSGLPLIGRMFVAQGASAPTAGEPRINGKMAGVTLRQAAEVLAKEAGKKLAIETGDGVDADAPIDSFQLVDADFAGVVRQINAAAHLEHDNRMDYRIRGDVLEFAPIGELDKRESALVAYDLTNAFNCDASSEDLVHAILEFVESDGWRDNGGTTANLKVVGTRMFVQAPPRYHERIAWILEQFTDRRRGGGGGAPAPRPARIGAESDPLRGSTGGAAAVGAGRAPRTELAAPIGADAASAAAGRGAAPGMPGGGMLSAPAVVNTAPVAAPTASGGGVPTPLAVPGTTSAPAPGASPGVPPAQGQ